MSYSETEFRHAMSQYATGVVVVAGNENGNLVGFAAQSFVSLSLDPPLVLFCPQRSSTSWPRIRACGKYSINILPEGDDDISEEFAVAGKVPDIDWQPTIEDGSPMLKDALAVVECSFESEALAGDHTIVVSAVTDVRVLNPESRPLLYFRGQYVNLSD